MFYSKLKTTWFFKVSIASPEKAQYANQHVKEYQDVCLQ